MGVSLLTDGIFDANKVAVGVILVLVTLATLAALLRRLWHR